MSAKFPPSLKATLGSQGKFLITEVDEDTIISLLDWLMDNIDKGKREFELLISSSGGRPTMTLYFASLLRSFPRSVRLTGVAIGECNSAALALLQCCHKRIAVKNTGFFIHRVQTPLKLDWKEYDEKYIKEELAQSRMIEEQIVALQCERIGMPKEQWNAIAELGEKVPGVRFYADEALKLKIVDEIVDHYPLFPESE